METFGVEKQSTSFLGGDNPLKCRWTANPRGGRFVIVPEGGGRAHVDGNDDTARHCVRCG